MDEAVKLVRLLCEAVSRLPDSEMLVSYGSLQNDPEFRIRFEDRPGLGGWLLSVDKIRKEYGEVLDVKDLEEAEYIDVQSPSGAARRVWRGKANGVYVSFTSEDVEPKFYVSPILTMRTYGVALLDETGNMVAHEVKNR